MRAEKLADILEQTFVKCILLSELYHILVEFHLHSFPGIQSTINHCPACRTSLIATRFWVVMICPIIKCFTVLRVFFYFVWFVFIHHNFQFYFELCTYCTFLDIYLSQNLNFVNYLLFYMKLLNYLFFNMFGSVLECCELTGVSLLWPWLIKWK